MVSIVIPAYNRANIVGRAIESCLNQTYTDIEVIVVDDGSSDNTRNVILAINDKRLKYVYQDNAGACVARNHGIELAQGEYIAFHDSDDIWLPQKLEKQMKIFELYNADIVFCKLRYKKKNGSIEYQPNYMSEGFLKPIKNLFGIGTQTIVAKRKVFENIRFDKELPRFQEFEMLYRASREYSIYCLDEGLVDYEIGVDSISGNPRRLYEACTIILEKHPEMKKDYPMMMEFMAHSLLSSANILKEKNDPEHKKFVRFAFQCKVSPRLIFKAVLIETGLYSKRHH